MVKVTRTPTTCTSAACPDRVRHRHLPGTGFVLALATLLLSIAFGARAVETVMVDGVPHVKNGATPTQGVEKLPMKEIWRHGGDDDEDVLFGMITDCAVGPDGNIYLLDAQLMQVLVFSPTGEVLPSLGRQGQGPGEFQNARQMVFLPDGTLGVAQLFPGKLIGLNLDGTPAKDLEPGKNDPTAGGFMALINAESGGENLILSGIEITFDQANATQKRHYFVRSYGMDAKPIVDFLTDDREWHFDDNFVFEEKDNDFVWQRLAVGHDGHVVVAIPRNEYVLSVFASDGTLERVIERPYETWTRDERVRKRFDSLMAGQARQFPAGTEHTIADTEADIEGIRYGEDGTIWVVTSRTIYTPKPDVLTAWDVFSPQGEFIKQVEAHAPGDPASDLLFLTDKGYAVQIVGFWDAALSAMGGGGDDSDDNGDAAPMQVICYKTD